MTKKPELTALPAIKETNPLMVAWHRVHEGETAQRRVDYSALEIGQVVDACMETYGNTLKTLLDLNMDPSLARENAGRMWRIDLPELTSKHEVLAYIACVAWGQRMRILDAAEVKSMIFMAQTQLSVLKQTVPAAAGKLSAVNGIDRDQEPLLPGLKPINSMPDPAGREARK
jgi:hypothetical protein